MQPDQPTGPARTGVHSPHARRRAPSPLALPAGTRVGKYEIIRVLGRGGMGQVYLARDVVLGRRVAIKFMLDARAAFVERFLTEARATARCQHENIVVLHEMGDYHEYAFIVFEYLEGETLAKTIAAGPHPPQRALELVVPVARALVHAHAHGIVHRDLKPENVFVTADGAVKVLDFGIAAAFEGPDRAQPSDAVIGTPLYMAPEQSRGEPIDHRADLWAFGLLFYELLAGQHPLGDNAPLHAVIDLADAALPLPIARDRFPAEVAAILDRCLAKDPGARFATAEALLDALVAVSSAKRTRSDDTSPYPGLAAFGDSDADVYFGRGSDVRRGLARLRDQPLVAVVGPSGVGKSSFVRAGLAPALAETGGWDVVTTRPGRDALRGLAALAVDAGEPASEVAIVDRIRAEPGYLAEVLRDRARRTRRQLLLFVDQFEELYTMVPTGEDRATYAACLVAIADDVAAPLRVVVAMRSDFLDRIAENAELVEHISRGLMFLSPLDRAGLREALAQPAALAGYTFESEEVVDDIVDALEQAPGALPLLQFVANRMWDARDRTARRLTAGAYQAMGGVVGAIAAHADQVIAELPQSGQLEVRGMFQRLVTPERTRAIVELRELVEASRDGKATLALIDTLVRARLLVVSGEGDARTVEIIHDSLITDWPKLASWIEDEKELVAFASELRTAVRQWDERGRPVGLLWRGDVLALARRMRASLAERGALGERERAFLDAAVVLDERALRVRRRLVIATLAILALAAAGATIAMVSIRSAERTARFHAERARDQARDALAARERADREAERARDAEAARGAELDKRRQAELKAETATSAVVQLDQDLAATNKRLAAALEEQRRVAERARAAQTAAEHEAQRAQQAEEDVKVKQRALEQLLGEREARVKKLEEQLRKISVDLK